MQRVPLLLLLCFCKIALTLNSDPLTTASSRFHWAKPGVEKITTWAPTLRPISDGVLPTYLPSRVISAPERRRTKITPYFFRQDFLHGTGRRGWRGHWRTLPRCSCAQDRLTGYRSRIHRRSCTPGWVYQRVQLTSRLPLLTPSQFLGTSLPPRLTDRVSESRTLIFYRVLPRGRDRERGHQQKA
jgi:hypothetical protein